MKNKIHDLDNVLISPRILASWLAHLESTSAQLMWKHPDLKASEIPDEQFRELPSGGGEIFVKVRSTVVRMAVPAGEWEKI